MKKILLSLNILILVALTYSSFIAYRNNINMKSELEKSRFIYVYSLEDVLLKTNIMAKKQAFEQEVLKLNEELKEAEKKIDSVKNAKVKFEVSDLYLGNLKLKRDTLMADYQKEIDTLTVKINKALVDIVEENNIPAVFLKDTIAVETRAVINISDEVAKRIQE